MLEHSKWRKKHFTTIVKETQLTIFNYILVEFVFQKMQLQNKSLCAKYAKLCTHGPCPVDFTGSND